MKIYFLSDVFLYYKTGIYNYSKELARAMLADPNVNINFITNGETKDWKLEKELKKIFGPQVSLHTKYKILKLTLTHQIKPFFFDDLFDKYKEKYEKNPKNSYKIILESIRLPRKLGWILASLYSRFSNRVLRKYFSYFSKGSVLFSPYQTFRLSKKILNSHSVVTTVHDLIPLIHPEYFEKDHYFKKRIFEPLKYADLIVTVSENTKLDLLNEANFISQKQVEAIHIAASDHFKPTLNKSSLSEIKSKYGIPENSNYVFTVCTIEPRKNHKRLIEAWQKAYSKISGLNNPHLVICGRKGWGDELNSIIKHERNIMNSIIFTGYIPDEDLPILYSGASFSIYPSLYEGFGLPVLESMKCKTFCLTSNISSMPEIVGPGFPNVDPNSVDDITEKILLLSNNSVILNHLSHVQYERSKLFNWDKTYQKTKTAIKGLIEKKNN
ncbi:MAG: glycosyltransferase family 4 protein [Coraliomargaritaceae bacterium]